MKTLVELFETSVARFGDNILMWEKTKGQPYQGQTYKQVHEQVVQFGAGLMALGISKGDRLGLVAEGRTDWLVSELGMFYAGAINVPLSVKLDAGTEIAFRLKHSGARMAIVSWTQAEKVEEIRSELPDLEKIIYLDEIPEPAEHRLSFAEIKKQGAQ